MMKMATTRSGTVSSTANAKGMKFATVANRELSPSRRPSPFVTPVAVDQRAHRRVRGLRGEISDFDSFHTVCARILAFPAFYGRNMNAWIDCMTCVDDPAAGMSSVTVRKGEQLTLEIPGSMALKERAPDVFDALVERTAAVNERFVEDGDQPVIALVLA